LSAVELTDDSAVVKVLIKCGSGPGVVFEDADPLKNPALNFDSLGRFVVTKSPEHRRARPDDWLNAMRLMGFVLRLSG
jgi:hypothetical protein